MPEPIQSPIPPNPNPSQSTEAATQIGARLNELFPDGVLPEPEPIQPGGARTPAPVAPPAAPPVAPPVVPPVVPAGQTGATGGPGATGIPAAATGTPPPFQAQPAAVPSPDAAALAALVAKNLREVGLGPTGATGPAASGATGATGAVAPSATGATGVAATGAAASGASGPQKPTEGELDTAEKAMTIPAGTAFKAVRMENKQLEQRALAAETKLRDLQSQPAGTVDVKEVAALKKQVADYELEFRATRVEATPDFKKASATIERAQTQIKAFAAAHKISEGELTSVLNTADPAERNNKLSELITDINVLEQRRAERLVGEIDEAREVQVNLRANAGNILQEWQASQDAEKQRVAQEFQQNWKTALDTSFSQLATTLPIFQPTGDEKWDSAIAGARESVRGIDVNTLTNEQIAEAFYKSKVFPMLLNMVGELHQNSESLNDTIAKLRGTSVPVGGGSPVPEAPIAPAPQTFAEAAKSSLTGLLPP